MRVRYTRTAAAHLRAIAAYTIETWPGVAPRVAHEVRTAVEQLAAFPDAGRPGRVPGTRELVMVRLPFIIAYRVTEDCIDVLAILHASRGWPGSFSA